MISFPHLPFQILTRFHAALDLLTGASILFAMEDAAAFLHGAKDANKLLGSTHEDKIAIRTSESLVGVLLVDVAVLLGVISVVEDEETRRAVCYAGLGAHALMATWRWKVASKVPALKGAWRGQLVGDAVLASTWAYYLLQH